MASCVSCSRGKFSITPTATSEAVCGNCGTGSYSDGQYADGTGATRCLSCGPGTYSNTALASDASTCVSCGANAFAASGSIVCTTCPDFSTAFSGSSAITDCKCMAGYTGVDGGTCSSCTAGKYKSFAGAADCVSCGSFSTSPTASTSVTNCRCNPGYTGPDGGEAACADQRVIRAKAYKGQYLYKITFEASGRESTTGGPGGISPEKLLVDLVDFSCFVLRTARMNDSCPALA